MIAKDQARLRQTDAYTAAAHPTGNYAHSMMKIESYLFVTTINYCS